jgi:hypothetical protein
LANNSAQIANNNSGTLFTRGQTDSRPATVEHCTYFTGDQSAAIGEQGGATAGTAGVIASFKSNLAFSIPAYLNYYSFNNTNGLGPYIICDSGHTTGGSGQATADLIAVGQCDYNGSYGLRTTVNGNFYNYLYTTVPGSHDVTGDPGFVDPTRGYLTWGSTVLGITDVNPYVRLGKITSAMLAANDPSNASYNAAVSISGTGTSLTNWVRAGYAPTNSAYNFVYPGDTNSVTNVGAVQGSFGVLPTLSAPALFFC